MSDSTLFFGLYVYVFSKILLLPSQCNELSFSTEPSLIFNVTVFILHSMMPIHTITEI